jgi:hypothetical protein
MAFFKMIWKSNWGERLKGKIKLKHFIIGYFLLFHFSIKYNGI